ncbi:MAG: serine hydrolase [Bacteroidota bacterium]
MRFLYSFLLFLLLIPFLLPAQTQDWQGVDQYIDQALREWQVPGLAVAVVSKDSVLFMKGYGRLDLRDTLEVNEHTLFAIASNSKAFTATAMGMLVQEKRLEWDDPVLDHLPNFQLYDPIATRKLTIRDLFCHRVGLDTWSGDLTWYGSRYSRDQVMSRIRFQPPAYDFRTGYGYSNLMYLVAGQVIQSVSGSSWDEYVAKRLFRPLNMRRSNTSIRALDRLDNVATPHTYRAGETSPVPYRNVDNVGPAASINSSVAELSHWLQLQLNMGSYGGQSIVSPEIIQETRTSHNLLTVSNFQRQLSPTTHFRTYGLGWQLQDYHGRMVVQHTGGMDGMYSYTGFLPEEGVGVIVLSNRDNHYLINALPLYLFDHSLGIAETDWSQTYLELFRNSEVAAMRKLEKEQSQADWSQPTLPVEQYLGRYRCQMYGEATLQMQGDSIIMKLSGHPKIQGVLEHWQQDIWTATWNDPIWHQSKISFTVDPAGGVQAFEMQVRPDWIDPFVYQFERR